MIGVILLVILVSSILLNNSRKLNGKKIDNKIKPDVIPPKLNKEEPKLTPFYEIENEDYFKKIYNKDNE